VGVFCLEDLVFYLKTPCIDDEKMDKWGATVYL